MRGVLQVRGLRECGFIEQEDVSRIIILVQSWGMMRWILIDKRNRSIFTWMHLYPRSSIVYNHISIVSILKLVVVLQEVIGSDDWLLDREVRILVGVVFRVTSPIVSAVSANLRLSSSVLLPVSSQVPDDLFDLPHLCQVVRVSIAVSVLLSPRRRCTWSFSFVCIEIQRLLINLSMLVVC